MLEVKVAESRDHLVTSTGKKLFLLSDTLHMAFTHIPTDEWEPYLDYRKQQGFNCFAAMLLYPPEGGASPLGLYPFKRNAQGLFDYPHVNDEYFDRAESMVEIATKKGIIPALNILPNAYIPGNHHSKQAPQYVMPLEMVKPYVEYVSRRFGKYKPIFRIGGEINWGNEQTADYEWTILKTARALCPDALFALFDYPPLSAAQPPEEIVKAADILLYEGGHHVDKQFQNYTYAKYWYEKPVNHPIMNWEFCYEGHAYGGTYGRFDEFDVRKAIWQSLLSGAKAGVNYGSHGVWMWYDGESPFRNAEFGGKAYFKQTALRFKGAWDAGFARWIMETFDLFDLEPLFDGILNPTQEIRMSVSRDDRKVAIYAPHNVDVKVKKDLSEYDWTLIGMEDRVFARPNIVTADGVSTIKMWDFNSDALLLGFKN
jgi:hypothetical protein